MLRTKENNNNIKVGIIGVGNHMMENLVPSLQLIPGVELNAVCCTSLKKASRYANALGAKLYTDNWKELFDGQVNAVLVSADPKLHEEVVNYGLSKNIKVFCEKPLALTIKGLEKINLKSSQYKNYPGVGYNFLFIDSIKYAKDLSEQEIVSCFCKTYSSKPQEILWQCKSIEESFLFAVGIHTLSLIVEEFNGVEVLHAQRISFRENLFEIQALLNAKDGQLINLIFSNKLNRFSINFEMTFSDGSSVLLKDLHNYEFNLNNSPPLRKKESIINSPSPLKGGFEKTGYQSQLEKFLLEDTSPHMLEKSLSITKIIKTILKQVGLSYDHI